MAVKPTCMESSSGPVPGRRGTVRAVLEPHSRSVTPRQLCSVFCKPASVCPGALSRSSGCWSDLCCQDSWLVVPRLLALIREY